MKNFRKSIFYVLGWSLTVFLFAFSSFAQQVQRSPFDVTNYVMDVQIAPSDNRLNATVDVNFTPLEDTRTVTFEINGSLKVESITRQNSSFASQPKGKNTTSTAQNQVTFVQDQVGVSDLGPSVKVDLGDTVLKGTPVTLRFRYSGVLVTPQGGPLLTKRLASVGTNNGYLMYAARWFPFHNYAADQATSDISISLPGGFQLVGFSDAPVSQSGGKYRFVQSKPALIGNFAYGKYTNKTLRFGDYELQFYTKPGNDAQAAAYGETLSRALEYYTKQYGEPQGGKRLVIAQIDDESLDFYSTQGMIFMADRLFEQSRDITQERLQREAALQWWGLSVGLKSFDDAWLSQGLAEYSAFAFREATLTGGALEAAQRDQLERALTFEATASIIRAPSTLDDQSSAYQGIMFSKGSMVFATLRQTIGDDKFNRLMRAYFEQYRGKNASVADFERLTTQIAGENMRYFFARYVEGTGVPEFSADYQIIRTRAGKFRTRGTLKQNLNNLRLPVDLKLRAEGDDAETTVRIEDQSEDFDFESNGKPLEVIIDPGYKVLRTSEDLKITTVARRGIELYREGQYTEAQRQLEEALKLNKSSSWVYYHLGLIYLEQKNYQLARDNFDAALNGDLSPSWIEAWANIKRGNTYDAEGDRVRATDAYQKAIATNEKYDEALKVARTFLNTPYDPRAAQQQAQGTR